MSIVITDSKHYQNLANLIRKKLERGGTVYKPSQIVDEIEKILSENICVFDGEITETIVGINSDGEYKKALLVNSPIIANHYKDDTFSVRVYFDLPVENQIAYTIISNFSMNNPNLALKYALSRDRTQRVARYEAGGTIGATYGTYCMADGSGTTCIGYLTADSDGNLYIVPRSINYAVRPSKYTVEIRW